MRVRVEVCAATVAEALFAAQAGAESVELCAAPQLGGLTPGPGLLDALVARTATLRRVLLRPRTGGFAYGPDDVDVVRRDMAALASLDERCGFVVGALDAARDLDRATLDEWLGTAGDHEVTFHRAIDHARDPLEVLDGCLAIGVRRILSSGAKDRALDGADLLRRLVDMAKGRLVVAAAGGVRPEHVVELVERTGVPEVHFAAQISLPNGTSGPALSSNAAWADAGTQVDERKIEGLLNALVKAGLR